MGRRAEDLQKYFLGGFCFFGTSPSTPFIVKLCLVFFLLSFPTAFACIGTVFSPVIKIYEIISRFIFGSISTKMTKKQSNYQ